MTASHAPAGWYPNPDGSATVRWFDGITYTDHLKPATGAPFDISPPSMHQPGIPAAAAMSAPAGWYPNPAVPGQVTWWDGVAWGPSRWTAAGPSWSGYPPYVHTPYGTTTVVNVAPPKSVGLAVLLTLLFGPLGMLYSTVSGAVVMFGVMLVGSVFVGAATLGLALPLWVTMVWMVSMIWGGVAASNQTGTRMVTGPGY